MARSNQQKDPRTSPLADTQQNNKNLLVAGIFKVTQSNKIDVQNSLGRFLLNPSTWEEHKSSNWIAHNIPGQSDPIMQWTSGGARTVTFDALVTKDNSGYDLTVPNLTDNLISKGAAILGNIASSFLGITVPAIGDLLPIGDQGEGEELSIDEYLNYYRSLLYPLTSDDKTVLLGSPPLIAIFAGRTLSMSMDAGGSIGLDTDLWVLTDLRIKVTKQLPNLAPLEATVSFQLTEYIRRNKGQGDFDQGFDNSPTKTSDPVANGLNSLKAKLGF